MKDFYQLTPKGRARRVRAMAFKALEQYDLNVTRLRLLADSFNMIYRADTADGQKVVVRVVRPGESTLDELRSQALWCRALAAEAGLNVPQPVLTRSGDVLTVVSVDGVPEARPVLVASWIPGKRLADACTPDNVAKQGALMAQMHAFAQTFAPPPGFTLYRFDTFMPYHEPVTFLDGAYDHLLDAPDRATARWGYEVVVAALDDLKQRDPRMIPLHGDLHQWNVHLYRGEAYALDFDDMAFGWPIQDIGITLFYYHRWENAADLFAAFRRGYESVWPWPEHYPGELRTWILSRALNLMSFIMLRYDKDPEEAKWLPTCIENVRCAAEQVKALRVPIGVY